MRVGEEVFWHDKGWVCVSGVPPLALAGVEILDFGSALSQGGLDINN